MRLTSSTSSRVAFGEPDLGQIVTIDQDAPVVRSVESHHEAHERALARSARPDERRRGAGGGPERDVFEHRHVFIVRKVDVLEDDLAADGFERLPVLILFVLGVHLQQFADAVEPGEGVGDLCADVGHLDDPSAMA